MKQTTMLLLVGVICLVVLASGIGQAQEITLKLGTLAAVNSPAAKANEWFVELVAQKTGGEIKIEFFPASQLGGAIQQIESVMLGSQDMFQDAAVFYGQYVKDWNILSLAFTFRDQEHLLAFLNSEINGRIKEQLRKEYGIVVLAENWLRPPNIIATSRSIRELSDLSGLKMRVPEIEMYLNNWKQLGASPTVVAFGEAYLALRQGVVEGIDLPIDFLYPMKFFEVAPYVTMTNHLLTNGNIIINEIKWNSLSGEQQSALREAAEEAGEYYTNLAQKAWQTDEQKMIAEGTEFIDVDAESWQEKMAPLASELEEKGYWSKGLYEAIQELEEN